MSLNFQNPNFTRSEYIVCELYIVVTPDSILP